MRTARGVNRSAAMWLAYFLGFGLATDGDGDGNGELDFHPTVVAAVNLHGASGPGVGLRVRTSGARDWTWDSDGSFIWSTTADLRTVDVGLDLDLTSGAFTFQPWLGVHFATGSETTLYTEMDWNKPNPPPPLTKRLDPTPLATIGAMLALDVYSHDADRLCAFLELELSSPHHGYDITLGSSYAALTFGLAYRR